MQGTGKLRRLGIWALVGLLVVIAAVAALRYAQRPASLTVARNIQVTFTPEVELDPAPSPDGKLLAYARRLDSRTDIYVKAPNGPDEGVNLTGSLSTIGHRWPQWSPDGKMIAFVAMEAVSRTPGLASVEPTLQVLSPSGGTPRMITHASSVGHSWSPDGTKLVFIRGEGEIYVVSLVDGRESKIGQGYEAHAPAWSPNGKWIAFASGNRESLFSPATIGNIAPSSLWVVEAAGGKPRRITDADHGSTSPVWLPDSKSLLFVSNLGGTRDVFHLSLSQSNDVGNPQRITTGLNPLTIGITQDGKHLAYSLFLRKQNLWTMPIPESGTVTAESAVPVTTGSQSIEGVSVSRDGEWIAYDSNRSGNQDIYRMRRKDGKPERLTTDPHDDFLPSWSPTGEFIAFYSFRNGTRDLYVMSADGRNEQRVTSAASQERYPDWSPDGQSLVFVLDNGGPSDLYIVSRENNAWGPPRKLTSSERGAFAPRWSPDGTWIAYSDSANGLSVISPDGHNVRSIFTKGSFPFSTTCINWSADSKTLYFKARDNAYFGSLWSAPLTGVSPRRLVRFDAGHDSNRPEFAVDDKNLFFTLTQRESDIWMLDLSS